MTNNQLDIASPYSKPEINTEKKITKRINNTQGSVKHKHYGKLIIELIHETIQLEDSELKTYILDHIAQQMKRSYLNWNQTNVQDIQIWNDLEHFSNKKLTVDKTKVIPVFQTNPTRKKNLL